MKVIIDTGVWSEFLREGRGAQRSVAQEVGRLVRADLVQLLGPIRQELLSGARPDGRFEQLRDYLRYFPNLRLDERDDELAAEYYNRCKGSGIQGTGTDLLICAVAVRYGLKIFTLDNDFSHYGKVIPIKLHRIGGRLVE